MTLDNTTALVTGASRGLGLALAHALHQAGAHVFGLARSQKDLDALAQDLGERFTPLVCDVTSRQSVGEAFARVDEAGRGLDILVNNAGLGRFADVDAISEEDWHAQVDTNLSGLFWCTQEAARRMKAQGESRDDDALAGQIVNVASVAGLVGNPQISAYNATKFGVRGFSEATMKEFRPHGIRVSCVYPGSIDTAFFQEAGTPGNPHAMRAEDVAATILHVLEAAPSMLISEVVLRPMRVK